MNAKKIYILLAITVLVVLAIFLVEWYKPLHNQEMDNIKSHSANSYVGDQQCKSCHTTQYNDWLKSDHFKAMQEPADSTVLGNFNNARYTADGVTSYFFKKGEKFIINTQGHDGKNHDYEVKYTFGHFPLQQYLVEFPGGKLQATRVSWDSKAKKWFHQYADQKLNPHDWLHWTGNAQNWNTMCSSCHSTDVKKNYDIASDAYHTTYSIVNVSCESCHGPGKQHIDFIHGAYAKGERIPNSFLRVGKNVNQLTEINTCAPCHAVKGDISADLIHSTELLDNYIPTVPNTQRFYADGQINDEDFIYASFLQSKMYRHNVSCRNCHNTHSGKVLYAANQLCLQCHEKKYDDLSHTFHQVNTIGSECKSCHMAGKTYMGNDLRHDHSFRVPRPDLSVKYGTPNACNSCHKDKTAAWAAAAVVKWYGPARKYHFSDDLIPGSQLDGNSETHLTKLLSDTSVPEIVKATAINYLGRLLTPTSMNTIISYLKDSDAQIRYEAARSLMNFPKEQHINEIGALLSDKVRAVRIAGADLLTGFPAGQIPSPYLDALSKAGKELNNYYLYQADFAHGNISIADYYLRINDQQNAERFYLRALKMDSLANLPRIDLSILYNSQGRNKEALALLENAAKIDPINPEIFYNMALLHNEMNNKEASLQNFEKAYRLKSNNPGLYYNYGLLLQQSGNVDKAVKILEEGLKTDPTSTRLHYALAFTFLQHKQLQQARSHATILKKLDPANPEYQQLFSVLGIH
ncbi:MAG TPA: tetratricopeptide repeat protein [Agriterribacter sp.]|nr:tetratricopeptide repeat protein [Chitinophagaceae bacterium]HRP33266.1 tetratricopeptide repeat protein [Agriterribacter sp.]